MHPRKKLLGMSAMAVVLAAVSLGAMTSAAQEQGSALRESSGLVGRIGVPPQDAKQLG